MCGASDEQKQVNQEQIQFMQQLSNQYSTEYAGNKAIMDNLTSSLTPIINAGINQQGYSPAELTALNSQATQQAGQAYQQEAQALNENIGAQGGGNVFMPSAARTAITAGLGASAENNLSNQKLDITKSNFATGRQNYTNAVGMLAGVPGAIEGANTNNAGAFINSGNAAANEANSINAADNSWMGLVGGLAGGLGTAALNKKW